jgi:hypothetical protein
MQNDKSEFKDEPQKRACEFVLAASRCHPERSEGSESSNTQHPECIEPARKKMKYLCSLRCGFDLLSLIFDFE